MAARRGGRDVELVTASLSLWFALRLAWSGADAGLTPARFWAVLFLAAATLKIVGVWRGWGCCRIAGLLAGVGLWTALGTIIYLRYHGALTYGAFLLLAIWQAVAFVRVLRGDE